MLQLTTYDEEEWDADDITIMKKAQVRRQTVGTSVCVVHSEIHRVVVSHKLVVLWIGLWKKSTGTIHVL